jgi:hypothetical protein
MKTFNTLILFALVVSAAYASERKPTIQPISEAEAATIVKAQEEARERAKDLREFELRNADVSASAVARIGKREVLFNVVERVEPEVDSVDRSVRKSVSDTNVREWSEMVQATQKESVFLTLSGTVWDESVSEIWWDYEGERYRVFLNANFLLFPGLGEFEDEKTRYSLMTLIVGQATGGPRIADSEWRPTLTDFSSEGLEYIVVDPKDDLKIDPKAFAGIEAMLRYYAANYEEMQIRYENALKLRDARAAYLEANPPKERDTIINFRPKKNAPNSLSIDK